MKKRIAAVILGMTMTAGLLAGCAGSSSGSEDGAKASYTIGIEQFAEHGSLDNCREGFLEGLKEEASKREKISPWNIRTRRLIWVQTHRLPTILWRTK